MFKRRFFELPTSWFVAMRSIQLSYGRNKTSILGKPHGALSVDRAMCRRFTRGAHPNNTHRVLKAPRTADAGLWARRLIGPCTTKRRLSGYLIWRRGWAALRGISYRGHYSRMWRRERDYSAHPCAPPRWGLLLEQMFKFAPGKFSRTLCSGSRSRPLPVSCDALVRASHETGGERGIRTLDGLLTHTPLAGARLRPLGHLSARKNLARS